MKKIILLVVFALGVGMTQAQVRDMPQPDCECNSTSNTQYFEQYMLGVGLDLAGGIILLHSALLMNESLKSTQKDLIIGSIVTIVIGEALRLNALHRFKKFKLRVGTTSAGLSYNF